MSEIVLIVLSLVILFFVLPKICSYGFRLGLKHGRKQEVE
jgi:hypothetical protein